MNQKRRSELTEADQKEYKWVLMGFPTEKDPIMVRGVKLTTPPDDGHEYFEVTAYGDTEQVWARGPKKEIPDEMDMETERRHNNVGIGAGDESIY